MTKLFDNQHIIWEIYEDHSQCPQIISKIFPPKLVLRYYGVLPRKKNKKNKTTITTYYLKIKLGLQCESGNLPFARDR